MTAYNQARGWVAITGASSGIGAAAARHFAARGYPVALIARRRERLEALKAELDSPELSHLVVEADLSVDEGIDNTIEALSSLKLALLIHNAAVIQPISALMEVSRAAWRSHLRLNLEAPLFITQALTEQLKGGRVFHISSGAAHRSIAGWGAYCVSKAALFRLWDCFKEELATLDITLASVRPGVVDTEMQTEIRAAESPAFVNRPYFEELKAQGQLTSPEAVAEYLYRLFSEVPSAELIAREWDIRD
jgi:NAD(P)-dependent dehydrogenase (short-subunit alcohol dehydrogenase family)